MSEVPLYKHCEHGARVACLVPGLVLRLGLGFRGWESASTPVCSVAMQRRSTEKAFRGGTAYMY